MSAVTSSGRSLQSQRMSQLRDSSDIQNRVNVHLTSAFDLSDQQKTAFGHLFAAVGSKFWNIQIDELRDDVDHPFMGHRAV